MADAATLNRQLDALRSSGAAERDPVGFAYLEALVRRAATQGKPVRQILAARIDAVAAELASRPARAAMAGVPASSASPLAELLAYIGRQALGQPEATPLPGAASVRQADFPPKIQESSASRRQQAPELKSVAYFRDEWSKLSTEQQLTQTLAQAPENAGPMNSQHLVLRSLQVMRDIAPDYLHGFMSYVDALFWLERAAPAKPAPARSTGNEGQPAKRTAKNSRKNR